MLDVHKQEAGEGILAWSRYRGLDGVRLAFFAVDPSADVTLPESGRGGSSGVSGLVQDDQGHLVCENCQKPVVLVEPLNANQG